MCTASKVDMADSSASERNSNSESDFSDFEASIKDESNESALEPVGEIWPWMNRQEEMKIERAKKQRIKSPYTTAASVKEVMNGECITLVNIVSENHSWIDYRMLLHSVAYE